MSKDIHVNDRQIDALMAEYGYKWNEHTDQYENGELIVSGDFASEMCKRITGAESSTKNEVTPEEALKVAIEKAESIEENMEYHYFKSCQVPYCRHQPCVEDPEYPPKQYLNYANITRERTYIEAGDLITVTSVLKRHFKTDDENDFVDGNEVFSSIEVSRA